MLRLAASTAIFLSLASPALAWCQYDDLRCKALEAQIQQAETLDRIADQATLDAIMRQNAAQKAQIEDAMTRLNTILRQRGERECHLTPSLGLAC